MGVLWRPQSTDFTKRPANIVTLDSLLATRHATAHQQQQGQATSPLRERREKRRQVYELDALKADDFKLVLRETIESVIDRPAYEAQVGIEEKQAGFLEVFVKIFHRAGKMPCSCSSYDALDRVRFRIYRGTLKASRILADSVPEGSFAASLTIFFSSQLSKNTFFVAN